MTSPPGPVRRWWSRVVEQVLAGNDPAVARITPEAFLLDVTFYGSCWSMLEAEPSGGRGGPVVPTKHGSPIPVMRRPADARPSHRTTNHTKDVSR